MDRNKAWQEMLRDSAVIRGDGKFVEPPYEMAGHKIQVKKFERGPTAFQAFVYGHKEHGGANIKGFSVNHVRAAAEKIAQGNMLANVPEGHSKNINLNANGEWDESKHPRDENGKFA